MSTQAHELPDTGRLEIDDAKERLRQVLRQYRRKRHRHPVRGHDAVCESLTTHALEAVKGMDRVAAYVSVGHEPCTRLLLERLTERGDEERVDPPDLLRGQDPAAGLRGAPGGPLGQVRRPPVVGPAARQVRAEDRQEHADPALVEALQQQPGAGLVAHGHVGGDSVHPLHRLQCVRGQ